ncbi:MAG: HypC/HybG/HupF family hydrogenase formation chaperone [Candidatus Hydrogenedentes bacterium CG07_land_8_20_14_0_80_42_17]|nr:MAG: hypothetical protein AUJ18_08670 [Candidatus Hydrogenedentes bacterium CG1_02_42_14]PIU46751.1 MAG: HypC/HybG/HupF family hydrogenase formation chaperone [Candidatus Hydrogenedentes bacterium CG07_land_8_20_14_0_80_42_17]
MCLAIPARILERKDDLAIVELEGVKRECSLQLLPEACAGDWVILHAGFAIERLDEESAMETLNLLSSVFEAETSKNES